MSDQTPQAQTEDAAVMSGLAELLAAEEAAPVAAEPPAEESTESDETATEAEDASEPVDDGTDDEDGSSESDEDEPVEDAPKSDDEPELDAATQRKLEAIQRAEKRAKESADQALAELRAERASFAKEREQWAPALEEFHQLKAKARHNPAAVLSALGLSEGDFELAARQLYSLSPAAANDPKARASAQAALREREAMSRLDQLEQRNQELERRIVESESAARQERYVAEYMSGLTKAVGNDNAPLVARRMAKDEHDTRGRLSLVAQRIMAETNEIPDHSDVVAEYEKELRAELERVGIDPLSVLTPTKKPTQQAGEQRAAKSLSNELSPSTKPRTEPLSEEEERLEIIRGLQQLNS